MFNLGYVHSDFHWSNVLLDDDNNVKIIDFGMATRRDITTDGDQDDTVIFHEQLKKSAGRNPNFMCLPGVCKRNNVLCKAAFDFFEKLATGTVDPPNSTRSPKPAFRFDYNGHDSSSSSSENSSNARITKTSHTSQHSNQKTASASSDSSVQEFVTELNKLTAKLRMLRNTKLQETRKSKPSLRA